MNEIKTHNTLTNGESKFEGVHWETYLAVFILALILFAPMGNARVGAFTTYFLSILLEAVPFILFGALLSGMVEVFLPGDALPKLTRRLGPLGIPLIALFGVVFPVCECGVVVVARRLLRKGLPLSHAITYLLAAPIFNPVVLLSTWFAFSPVVHPGPLTFVLARGIGGLVIAVVLGFVLGRVRPKSAFTPEFIAELDGEEEHSQAKKGSWYIRVMEHARDDFLLMAPFLMFGVACAATMQTFVPRDLLASINGIWGLGPLTMMTTAFALSLCSEADAFVASTFILQFSFPAIMSFLVLGPMLDVKLLLMYRTVFKRDFIIIFSGSIVAAVLVYAAILGVFIL